MSDTATPDTIQIIPDTWVGQMGVLLVGLEAGGEARSLARRELFRMAHAADLYVSLARQTGLLSLDHITEKGAEPLPGAERCAYCGANLYGIVRSHHHTEDGVDVTR